MRLGRFVTATALVGVLAFFSLDGGRALAHRGGDDDDDEQEIRGALVVNGDGTVSVGGLLLQVTEGTEIELDDRDVSFQELAAFAADHPTVPAEAEFVALGGRNVATEIEVEDIEDDDDDDDGDDDDGDDDDGDDHGRDGVEAFGVLLAINGAAGTVTVQLDGSQARLVLAVHPQTEIEVDEADLTLAQLAAVLASGREVPVRVEYFPHTLIAKEIDVQVPLAQDDGEILAVDSQTRTVAVRRITSGPSAAARTGRRRGKLRFQLLPGSIIADGDRLLRIHDLRRGDQVRADSFASRGRRLAPRLQVTGRTPS